MEIRPEPLPVTRTTGVCPRGAQVRALAGLSVCPASSPKQIHAPSLRAILLPSATSVFRHTVTASSSRSAARWMGTCGLQPMPVQQ